MLIKLAVNNTASFNDDCALLCAQILAKFHGYDVNWQKAYQTIRKNQYGYDLLEIADFLLNQGVNLEVGHYDSDYIIRKRGEKFIFTADSLLLMTDHLPDQPAYLIKSLKSNIRFLVKHPKHLRIYPLRQSALEKLIFRGLPFQIHLDMYYLTKDKNHTIHSAIICGINKKTYYILDPVIGLRLVEKELIIRSWRASGSYYLFIKKRVESLESTREGQQ